MTPIYLHIYCTQDEAHNEIRKASDWLRFHKGFVVKTAEKIIITDDIVHMFKVIRSPNDPLEWLSGLRLSGFKTCNRVELTSIQRGFLKSRVSSFHLST